MTIPEINEQLGVYVEALMDTQRELEECLRKLPAAKQNREAQYNSTMIQIIGTARANKEKEPPAAVKESMCEIATEKQSLDLRVLDYAREGLRSRLDVLQVAISVLQTQCKLLNSELDMSRYGRSNAA